MDSTLTAGPSSESHFYVIASETQRIVAASMNEKDIWISVRRLDNEDTHRHWGSDDIIHEGSTGNSDGGSLDSDGSVLVAWGCLECGNRKPGEPQVIRWEGVQRRNDPGFGPRFEVWAWDGPGLEANRVDITSSEITLHPVPLMNIRDEHPLSQYHRMYEWASYFNKVVDLRIRDQLTYSLNLRLVETRNVEVDGDRMMS